MIPKDYNLPPIQCYYQGVGFRSRLEGRWAIYMDQEGIEWDYEPTWFDFGRALGCYKPDFLARIDGRESWAEVKHEFNAWSLGRCEELVRVTGIPCILLQAPPEPRQYQEIRLATVVPGGLPYTEYVSLWPTPMRTNDWFHQMDEHCHVARRWSAWDRAT